LSGIVSEDSTGITTTTLPVVYEFHTRYVSRSGARVRLRFASGSGVSINALVGNPFFRATNAILDVGASVLRVPDWNRADGTDANFNIDWRQPVVTPHDQLNAPGAIQYSRTHFAMSTDVVGVLRAYAPTSGFLPEATRIASALCHQQSTSALLTWPPASDAPRGPPPGILRPSIQWADTSSVPSRSDRTSDSRLGARFVPKLPAGSRGGPASGPAAPPPSNQASVAPINQASVALPALRPSVPNLAAEVQPGRSPSGVNTEASSDDDMSLFRSDTDSASHDPQADAVVLWRPDGHSARHYPGNGST
jgi:hypothetical protein